MESVFWRLAGVFRGSAWRRAWRSLAVAVLPARLVRRRQRENDVCSREFDWRSHAPGRDADSRIVGLDSERRKKPRRSGSDALGGNPGSQLVDWRSAGSEHRHSAIFLSLQTAADSSAVAYFATAVLTRAPLASKVLRLTSPIASLPIVTAATILRPSARVMLQEFVCRSNSMALTGDFSLARSG